MHNNLTIAEHYLRRLITGANFFSTKPIKDTALLFPPFLQLLQKSIDKFNVKYPAVKVVYVETYRSNALQLQHYNNGASGIKKNGMHHYGIAADLAFNINGKFTYNGDYKYLRECHTAAGLHLLGAWDIGHVQYIPANANDQAALRLTVNNAVKAFQRKHGLTADGIAGPKTIAKAKEVYS